MRHDVKGHYLKPNHRNKTPHNILVYDTETRERNIGGRRLHKMFMAWCVYAMLDDEGEIEYENWRYYESSAKLNAYIESLCQGVESLLIVGNNIFFDLQAVGFFPYFTERGWKCAFYYESGLSYILRIRKAHLSVTIVSLTNFLESSVKTLGDLLGLPKLGVDLKRASHAKMKEYCKRDTEITLRAFSKYIQFIVKHDMGMFSLTRASQAMHAFRHRFMGEKIYVHSDKEIQKLEEASYFGGRTEAFALGVMRRGPFVDLDINSMYPYVMKHKPMPVHAIDLYKRTSVRDLRDVLTRYGAIAHVTLSTDSPAYPYRMGGKVLFPVGVFDTTLCTDSLKRALAQGEVKAVHSFAVYELADIFSPYVDFMYALRNKLRAEKEAVGEKTCKLLLNSLYGKFAMRIPVEVGREFTDSTDFLREEAYDEVTGEWCTITHIMGTIIETRGTEIEKNSVMAIPSHVTDYARNELWDVMREVGLPNVLYCDTDSVKVRKTDAVAVKHRIHESRLGALKVESVYRSLRINGLKDYATEKGKRLKGVPERAVQLTDNSFTYDQFLRQSSHLRMGIGDGVMITKVVKTLRRRYTKGVVMPSGAVRPFRFPDELSLAQALARS